MLSQELLSNLMIVIRNRVLELLHHDLLLRQLLLLLLRRLFSALDLHVHSLVLILWLGIPRVGYFRHREAKAFLSDQAVELV